jgi:hypothetical protein
MLIIRGNKSEHEIKLNLSFKMNIKRRLRMKVRTAAKISTISTESIYLLIGKKYGII